MRPQSFFFCIIGLFVLILQAGCATMSYTTIEPPPLPEGVMGARWGNSVEEIKKTIDTEGIEWFQDKTDEPPYALYASGTYLKAPAIFSFFFTPRSKKLYKVTVTLDDLTLYDKVKAQLIQRFGEPSFSQSEVDHWSWKDKSLVILQRDSSQLQMSYLSGPFLIMNHEEGGGPVKK